jgi:RNA polymerase sigma-70 factor (ECF subfamily)
MSTVQESQSVTAPALSERLLIERVVREADRVAFADLYDLHARSVFAYAYSRLQDRSEAEEVTQDVFVTYWERRASARITGDSVLPWLLVTCKNLARNRARSLEASARRRADDVLDETAAASEPGPEERAEEAELRALVETAIQGLTERDQAIVRLCLGEGLGYDEVARQLETTNGVVRNRLSRLRTHLRSELRILRGNRS